MLIRRAVGHAIRTRRQTLMLNMRQVSAKSGVSLGHLSEVERGIKEPSSELLRALVPALDWTPTELVAEAHRVMHNNDLMRKSEAARV